MTQREEILLQLSDKKNVSVELGDIQDLEKLNDSYFKRTDNLASKIKGVLSDARNIELRIEDALKDADKIKATLGKAKQNAKSLGIDDSNISAFKDADVAIKDSLGFKSVLSTISKFVTSI